MLAETAKLHAGDAENLPAVAGVHAHCLDEIERIYRRLDVRSTTRWARASITTAWPRVVDELLERGIARESDGAIVRVPRRAGRRR